MENQAQIKLTKQPVWLMESLPRKLHMIPHLKNLAYYPDFRLPDEKNCAALKFCFRLSADCGPAIAIRVDGVLHQAAFPHLMIKKPGQQIEFLNAGVAKALYFSYPPETSAFFLGCGIPPDLVMTELEETGHIIALIELLAKLSNKLGESGVADLLDLECYSLAHKTLLQISASKQTANIEEQYIRKIATYMQRHFHEKVDMETLARNHGFSYRSMLRHWKRVFKQTPSAYLNKLKLLESKRLLKESDLRVIDIAFQLGFCDVGHFCRFFRQHAGAAPQKFRQS